MTRNGQLLRTIRGVTGISRAELARRCGVSVETLKKIEGGRGDGSADTWEAILRIITMHDYILAGFLCGKTSQAVHKCSDCAFPSQSDLALNAYRSSFGMILYLPTSDYSDSLDLIMCGVLYFGNVTQYEAVLKKQLEVLGS